MQPQKLVTTEAVNALGEKVKFRACSRPTKEAEAIYRDSPEPGRIVPL